METAIRRQGLLNALSLEISLHRNAAGLAFVAGDGDLSAGELPDNFPVGEKVASNLADRKLRSAGSERQRDEQLIGTVRIHSMGAMLGMMEQLIHSIVSDSFSWFAPFT